MEFQSLSSCPAPLDQYIGRFTPSAPEGMSEEKSWQQWFNFNRLGSRSSTHTNRGRWPTKHERGCMMRKIIGITRRHGWKLGGL